MLEPTIVKSTQSSSIDNTFSQIDFLKNFLDQIADQENDQRKEDLLDVQSKVSWFFLQRPQFFGWVLNKDILSRIIVKSLILIEQADTIFSFVDQDILNYEEVLNQLLDELRKVELFYQRIGGIIGYHHACLRLIKEQKQKENKDQVSSYYPPTGIDLTIESLQQKEFILEGIRAQKYLAELYPVGGAADRLNLHDEKTHSDLPAARLEFLGRTLLEGMIRDVQAREYLYYKLFSEQVTTPIALMTSQEKNNSQLVAEIIEQHGYFGRAKDSFIFFSQPLVPTVTENGLWCLKEPMKLLLKPGGHGVIWKLASEQGVFAWIKEQGKNKVLVRQINNPVAGVDLGLIAFIGVGYKENKAFGFASCPRRVKTSEGMNIVKETSLKEGVSVVLSNIEYCDFEKCGIDDAALNPEEPYSIFPSNTNILFGDLDAIEQGIKKCSYPGMLVNFKNMQVYDPHHGVVSAQVARLELLMQNIADAFEIQKGGDFSLLDLPVFITFNKRHKTISPTKKEFVPGAGLVETALGCFYDYLKNGKELLEDSCKFKMPTFPKEDAFLKQGPSFIFIYHPAIGPLYSVIGQKIKGGFLGYGSELQLEIADVCFEQLHIEGSLLIQARQILGHSAENRLVYSEQTGRCFLKNVKVKNKGIRRSENNVYWRNKIDREETCYIQLQGCSEFVAENVILDGDYHVVVKDGERVIAIQEGDHVVFLKEVLDKKNCSSYWSYNVGESKDIVLNFQK